MAESVMERVETLEAELAAAVAAMEAAVEAKAEAVVEAVVEAVPVATDQEKAAPMTTAEAEVAARVETFAMPRAASEAAVGASPPKRESQALMGREGQPSAHTPPLLCNGSEQDVCQASRQNLSEISDTSGPNAVAALEGQRGMCYEMSSSSAERAQSDALQLRWIDTLDALAAQLLLALDELEVAVDRVEGERQMAMKMASQARERRRELCAELATKDVQLERLQSLLEKLDGSRA
eukprot:6188273-Pleurochrysis_carterae.AAC.4